MTEDTRLGTELAGYRIESLIGRGGMGVVYLAEHLRLGRKVALKLLPPEFAQNEKFRERFLRESRVAASIDHPNIVPIYDADESEGVLYIALRYVEGTDLRTQLKQQGPLPLARAVSIIRQVASALDTAHARGLVHRDVKPANILLAPGSSGADHVYLSDFGLTKRALSVSGLTQTGQLVGTIDYVAPEQIKGDPVDGRVDIYSLGCVLFESLTGSVPYPRDMEVAVLWAHVQEPPPSLAEKRGDLPTGVNDVVARAMAKDPAERYRSAGELAADLRTNLTPAPTGRPVSRRSRPRIDRAAGPAHRRIRGGRFIAIAAGAAIVVIAATVFALTRGGEPLVPGIDSVARIDVESGEFTQVVDVGAQPTGVAVGEGAVWVIDQATGTVSKIDPTAATQELTTSTRGTPTGIAVGEGFVWITNGFGGEGGGPSQVVRVNPDTDAVEPAFEVPPGTQAIAAGFGSVWVADGLHSKVLRYDPLNLDAPPEQIRVGPGQPDPSALVVAEGEAEGIWVANSLGNTVSRIDPETNEIRNFGVQDAPTAIAAGSDSVWVTSSEGDSVTRLDPAGGTVQRIEGVPDGPASVVVAADGVWVAAYVAGVVFRIDLETNEVVEQLPVGGSPDGLSLAQDGDVWVTVHEL